MRFGIVALVWVLSLSTTCLSFAKPKELSLQEAVLLALRFNPKIQTAEMSRVSQKFALRQAQNAFELQYGLEASLGVSNYSKTFKGDENPPQPVQNQNQQAQNQIGNGPATFFNSFGITPTVSWKSPYGTAFSLSGSLSKEGRGHTTSATLKIEQPLLRGFGRDVVEVAIKNAYDAEERNRLGLRETIGDSILEVVSAYRELVKQNNVVESQERQLEAQKRTIVKTKANIQAGKTAPSELSNYELNYEEYVFNLQNAKNSREQQRQKLLEGIGLDPELEITVPNDIQVELAPIPKFEDILALALSNNKTYQERLINLRASERALKVAENGTLPVLNLASTTGVSSAGIGAVGSLQGGRSFTTNQSVNLSLNVPINDYSIKAKLLDSKITYQNALIELEGARRTLITNVKNSIRSLKNAAEQIKTAEKRVEKSRKSYEDQLKMQQAGRASSVIVTDQQQKVLDSEKAYIEQKIAYLNAVDSLNKLIGTTLIYWGIDLKY